MKQTLKSLKRTIMEEENQMENETPENEQVETTPEVKQEEKPEENKDLQSALAQKEHYKTKFEKSEADNKTLREEKSKVNNKEVAEQITQDPLEIVKLTKALGSFSEDEVEFILKNADGKTPEDIVKATKDEWVQTAITAKREKVANENNIPAPSSPSTTEDDSFNEELSVAGKTKQGDVQKLVEQRVAELESADRKTAGI